LWGSEEVNQFLLAQLHQFLHFIDAVLLVHSIGFLSHSHIKKRSYDLTQPISEVITLVYCFLICL